MPRGILLQEERGGALLLGVLRSLLLMLVLFVESCNDPLRCGSEGSGLRSPRPLAVGSEQSQSRNLSPDLADTAGAQGLGVPGGAGWRPTS